MNGPGVDPTATSRDTKGSLKRLARLLKPARGQIVLIMLLTLLATAASVAAPKFLGDATNVIVEGMASSGVDFRHLARVLLFVVALYVIYALASFVAGFIIRIVVQDLGFNLRKTAQQKIDKLPLSYVDQHQRGDLLSRVTNDIDNINQTLMQTFSQVISSLYMVIGIVGMMVWISWWLALLSVLAFPFGMLAMVKVLKASKPQFKAQWQKTGEVSSIVEESFTGHEIVALYNMQAMRTSSFDRANQELFTAGFKGQFYSQMMQPIMSFVANISFVVVAVAGALQVLSGALTIGAIQAFIQYSRQLNHPIGTLASTANLIQSGAASAERVFDFLDSEEMAPDTTAEIPPSAEGSAGTLSFENVSFGYTPDRTVITHLNLEVQRGQQVAIVGPTGAGKTTLVNLLMRFYDVSSGSIKIDGVPITNFSKDSLRSKIGMVLQDTWLFEGTIAENIGYGRAGATREEIVEAAKATGVDRLIRQLPEGYDTAVDDEDGGLSVGEKQLITIARAYISDPEILILDEATSSVDTRTEMLVQRAMNHLRTGRTSFVIAHRLSTIREADVIIVMVEGDVVEQGTHQSLMDRRGYYYDLYQSQFNTSD
ncbi:ABC transporter ATP-binding protein [Arcanobacterium bovis]|uniref:Fatty acid ABC transporter ATP-binding/permease protein n=1 Tax=Arcanobacterium bovis TaxID=2529275 RepID=A0A4Q9V2V5_9ACTO|nr:ABC transporter ATP-binding protein [Arcanobacterium bovis]TBW22792.1 ABC transporter ATP-binding protein [Arcanobacterium bovis]